MPGVEAHSDGAEVKIKRGNNTFLLWEVLTTYLMFVILNELKALNPMEILGSSRRSE